jgi:hypothetical protein
MTHHLAQVNISRLLAPLNHPKITEFVAQLEPINALADKAPGFVTGDANLGRHVLGMISIVA